MRDQDRGRAAFARQREESVAQFRRRHFVEMAEGFVRQHDVGLHGEGARDRHALAHAAGQFVRKSVGEAAKPQPVEPSQRALALLVLGQADQFERQLGVVERRAPGQQPVLLEHGSDAAAEEIEIGVRALVADGEVPSVGAVSPIIRSKKVDLPQPVWPTIATTSRGAMDRSSRSMATTDWPEVVWRNTLRKARTSIGGGPPCRATLMRATAACAPRPAPPALRAGTAAPPAPPSRRTRRTPRTTPAPPTIDGRCR